ncbi:MAG: hypothetical protein MAG431_02220 [Chloroflexi bacterium]|nr:hypothetical protein [Chloroflexota bacterium]
MLSKNKRVLKASEFSAYAYCKRAWWYGLKGVKPRNEHELVIGRDVHHQHGVQVFISGLLRLLAYILVLVALVLLTIYLTQRFV